MVTSVMDFFAGSGTLRLPCNVMELQNALDGGLNPTPVRA